MNPMFNEKPKVVVNEYKSLDEELEATVAGIFVEGRQSSNWVVDWKEELKDNLIPVNVALIKQTFEKWGYKL